MSQRGGFILLAVSMVLAVLAVLTFSLGKMSGLSARTEARAVDAERARLLAEAGLAHALRNMSQPPDNSICSYNDSFSLGAAETQKKYELLPPNSPTTVHGIGSYAVFFVRQSPYSFGESPWLLESRATLNNGTSYSLRLPLPANTREMVGIGQVTAPDKDTFVNASDPDCPYGSDLPCNTKSNLFLSGRDSFFFGDIRSRILVSFPYPEERMIFARIGLFRPSTSWGSGTVTAYRITQPWDEATATWDDEPSHDSSASGTVGQLNMSTRTGIFWMRLDPVKLSTATNGLKLIAPSDIIWSSFSSKELSEDKMQSPRLELIYLKGC